MKFLYLTAFLGMILLVSCEQKVKTEFEVEHSETDLDDLQIINETVMNEIDSRIDESRKVQSLVWEKRTEEKGSEFIKAEVYLNADGRAMKIIEHFVEGNFQPEGVRNYYLSQGEIIAYSESKNIWIDSLNSNIQEFRTLYLDGKPVSSWMRSSDTYDDIYLEEWENVELTVPSLENVNNILNGEGEFEPHFISIIQGDNDLFLLLGEPKEKEEVRFTTAVRVDEITPFIQDLVSNLDKYKFRPVDIQFVVVGGYNEPEFRVLTNIQWKE